MARVWSVVVRVGVGLTALATVGVLAYYCWVAWWREPWLDPWAEENLPLPG